MTFAGVLLAIALSALDQTIVGTAMPRIVADLGGFAHYTWLTTAYLVTSTVIMPITGKLTDMYGRKNFYIAGIAIFVIGSAASGLSFSMTQIILARAFQGIGAGIMLANAFATIGDLFPPATRGKYQGLISGAFGIASVAGPTLGGFITDSYSWHWIFYINVPLGILNIILFAIFFPRFRLDTLKHKIDYPGITVLVTAIVPLLLALSWGGTQYPWLSAPIIVLLAISVASMLLLPSIEGRSREPIISLWIFQHPVIAVSIPVIFLSSFIQFGGIIFIPLFFQGVLGLSATLSGDYLTPMVIGQMIGSFLSGLAISRPNAHYRLTGSLGLAIGTVGVAMLGTMNQHTSYPLAVLYIFLTGFGIGVTLPLYTIVIQNAVPYNVLGAATSSVPFFRTLGGSFGLAVFGGILTNRFSYEFLAGLPTSIRSLIPPDFVSSVVQNPNALLSPQSQNQLQTLFSQFGQTGPALYQQMLTTLRQALNDGLSEVFMVGAAVTFVSFIISFFVKEIPLRRQHLLAETPDTLEKTARP